MKYFAFISLLFFTAVHAECTGDLKMNVIGLDSSEGQVKFDLDDSAETFKPQKNGKKSLVQGKAPVADKKAEFIFKNIACGDYAIKLYHDENKNEDLDMNFIKVPKEDYTFSNCPGCLLPPSWEKAKFRFDKQNTEITIVVNP